MARKVSRLESVDVEVQGGGSVYVFVPLTGAGRAWIDANVQSEPWQWMGGGLVVEHRFARDLADGMAAEGLVVR